LQWLLVQKGRISAGISLYVDESGYIPEEERSEEEGKLVDLLQMIDQVGFGDEDVQLHLFTAASIQHGRFPIKRRRKMRWLFMCDAHELVNVQWCSTWDQVQKEFKFIHGDRQLLSIAATPFISNCYSPRPCGMEDDGSVRRRGNRPFPCFAQT
jgi:hypothetical protein